MIDIGEVLFRDILKVSAYPGSPFTGNIINDIVLNFFIPTVLLILIVFVLLGRLAVQQKGIRLLLGIAIYLFIVFSGYFAVFIMLGQFYFLFLVFILGIIYFIPTHFRVSSHGYPDGDHNMPSRRKPLSELKRELASLETQFDRAQGDKNDRLAQSTEDKIERIKEEIYNLEKDKTNSRKYR
jgi:hypothetical protein